MTMGTLAVLINSTQQNWLPERWKARFDTVWPASKLRFEASGRGWPVGWTVTKLVAVVHAAVPDPCQDRSITGQTVDDGTIGNIP